MDERADSSMVGKPIASWDLRHRLYLNKSVSPVCKDGGTIFRITSAFMDVCDQSFMYRHVAALAVLAMLLATAGLTVFALAVNFSKTIEMDLVS